MFQSVRDYHWHGSEITFITGGPRAHAGRAVLLYCSGTAGRILGGPCGRLFPPSPGPVGVMGLYIAIGGFRFNTWIDAV